MGASGQPIGYLMLWEIVYLGHIFIISINAYENKAREAWQIAVSPITVLFSCGRGGHFGRQTARAATFLIALAACAVFPQALLDAPARLSSRHVAQPAPQQAGAHGHMTLRDAPGVSRITSSRRLRRRCSSATSSITFTVKGKSLAFSSLRRACTVTAGKVASACCDWPCADCTGGTAAAMQAASASGRRAGRATRG